MKFGILTSLCIAAAALAGCGGGADSTSNYYPPEPREATTTSGAWAVGGSCSNLKEGDTITVNGIGEMTVIGINGLDGTIHASGGPRGSEYVSTSSITMINGQSETPNCS